MYNFYCQSTKYNSGLSAWNIAPCQKQYIAVFGLFLTIYFSVSIHPHVALLVSQSKGGMRLTKTFCSHIPPRSNNYPATTIPQRSKARRNSSPIYKTGLTCDRTTAQNGMDFTLFRTRSAALCSNSLLWGPDNTQPGFPVKSSPSPEKAIWTSLTISAIEGQLCWL